MKNYEYLSTLGTGRFGNVNLYSDILEPNKHVAIKIISKKLIREQNVVNQMKEEIHIMKMISEFNHPNIIKFLDTFEDKSHRYIVINHVDGGNLYDLVYEGPLKIGTKQPDKLVSTYIKQLVNALVLLHEHNIIHRDIKLENILLTGDKNQIILCDFGWAIETKVPVSRLCGTLDYLSPEAIRNIPYTNKIDMWATGILTYELLNVQTPFEAPTHKATYKNILKCEISYPEHFSQSSINFIEKLLVINPNIRLSAEQSLEQPYLF